MEINEKALRCLSRSFTCSLSFLTNMTRGFQEARVKRKTKEIGIWNLTTWGCDVQGFSFVSLFLFSFFQNGRCRATGTVDKAFRTRHWCVFSSSVPPWRGPDRVSQQCLTPGSWVTKDTRFLCKLQLVQESRRWRGNKYSRFSFSFYFYNLNTSTKNWEEMPT